MNWIKKHWKILISLVVGSVIIATSFTVLFWPQEQKASDVYILKFNGNDAISKDKNEIVTKLINSTRKALDEYSKYHERKYNEEFNGLQFQYTNLKSVQSDGEKNFYIALNQALKSIDNRLGINNILRTPESVNEGFYNKNTELLSFYWSPDYNGVGTWLKYMICDSFSMANFWPAIYQVMEANSQPWASSLKNELIKYTFDGKQSIYLNHDALLSWVNSASNTSRMSVSDTYVVIANVIGKWIKENSKITIEKNIEHDDVTNTDINNLVGYKDVGLGIQFVNFIASNPSSIPFVEDGPWTKTPWLVRDGFYNQINPNAETTYRDWFYEKSVTNNSKIRIWNANSPFLVNKTPLNPAFSNAPSASFFKSCWTGLTAWTTIGDNNSNQLKYRGCHLVSTGTTNTIDDLVNQINNSNEVSFKIRPIPWVDTNGNPAMDRNGNIQYLSPQDFTASIKAYLRSIECGLNSNDYFFNLIGIDVDKTLNDPNNNLRNTSATDQKVFKLYFSNRTLSATDCLDILQKQYFNAIPAFKQTVKNIIDDGLWKKYAVLSSNGLLNTTETNLNMFYGCGDWRKTWNDLVFTGEYYINNITEQNIVFKLNEKYFDSFENEVNSGDQKIKEDYISFNTNYKTKKGDYIGKFNIVDMKYAGSYNENILFEQFKSNELDVSPIQSANIVQVSNSFPNDMYYVSTSKLNKSDITSYNLQIYEKDNNGFIIDDNTGKGMCDANMQPTYSIDKYGNFDFHGKTPKLKSKVSKEYADLIVKDYFTPIEEGGISQLLRTTINNCINWVSLQTLVFPGITKSIQYSFMPFGVYEFDYKFIDSSLNKPSTTPPPFNNTNLDSFTKYWYFSSSKKYMSEEQLNNFNKNNFMLRKSGSIIWTYDELLHAMIH